MVIIEYEAKNPENELFKEKDHLLNKLLHEKEIFKRQQWKLPPQIMNKKRTEEGEHTQYNEKFAQEHLKMKKRLEIDILKNNKRHEMCLGVYDHDENFAERTINRERYKLLAKQVIKLNQQKKIENEREKRLKRKEAEAKRKLAEKEARKEIKNMTLRELQEHRELEGEAKIIQNSTEEDEIVESKVKVFVPIDMKVRREFLKQDLYKEYQDTANNDVATNQKRMLMEGLMASNDKEVFTGKSIQGKELS